MDKGFIIIDVILIIVVFLVCIWFLVKGYPNTLGSIINALK